MPLLHMRLLHLPLRRLGCCVVLATTALTAAASEPLLASQMTVLEERSNVVLHFEAGSAAELGSNRDLNGLVGRTRDFNGQSVPLYAITDGSVSAGRFLRMVQFPGQLAGTLQCQLVQLGNSPDLPGVKLAVLARQCALKSLNH